MHIVQHSMVEYRTFRKKEESGGRGVRSGKPTGRTFWFVTLFPILTLLCSILPYLTITLWTDGGTMYELGDIWCTKKMWRGGEGEERDYQAYVNLDTTERIWICTYYFTCTVMHGCCRGR